MVKAIQTGKRVNKVYSLLGKVIVKKYIDPLRLYCEGDGLSYWNALTSASTPRRMLKKGDTSVFNYISGISALEIKNKSSLYGKLATFYKELCCKYDYHREKGEAFYHDWGQYWHHINTIVSIYDKELSNSLSRQGIVSLFDTLTWLNKVDWSIFAKIPLHRDLHWGNILIDGRKINIIDFEHFCVGPIEYEFANAFFWDDEYSIDAEKLFHALEKERVYISKLLAYRLTAFYFIDQLSIALKGKDNKKVQKLVQRWSEFVKKHAVYFSFEKKETGHII